MDSIWIEDSKLYQDNIPSVQLLNSSKPIIENSQTIELPPLPPTSYFQTLLKEQEAREQQEKLNQNQSNGKFLKLFKKLSISHKDTKQNEQVIPKQMIKISTPFAFSHISHVDNKPIEQEPTTPKTNDESQDRLSPLIGKVGSNAICFNPTSPTSAMKSSSSSFTRSVSTSTIQSSVGKNSLFSRSESISSSLASRKNSINQTTPLSLKKFKTIRSNNHDLLQESMSNEDDSQDIELEYNKHINYNLQEIIKSIDDFNEDYEQISNGEQTANDYYSHEDINSILNYHEVEHELMIYNQKGYIETDSLNGNESDEVVYDKF